MPRIRRRLKRYERNEPTETPEEKRARMIEMLDIAFIDPNEYRELWLEIREGYLAEWIAERPGTRPAIWWLVDAREPRLMIQRSLPFNGSGHLTNPCRCDPKMQGVYRCCDCPPNCRYSLQVTPPDDSERRPIAPVEMQFYCHHNNGNKPHYLCEWFEPETDYLDRCGLLTDDERAALGR